MKTTLRLDGKVALVTGSARGIGLATARLFSALGASVIAQDLNPAVNHLSDIAHVHPFVGDVSSERDAQSVVEEALRLFGRIDILVNNAGKTLNKSIVATTVSDWDLIMATNAKGYFLHGREALKYMIPQRSGVVINVASMVSQVGLRETAAYAASKGAIAQLTKVMAIESGPFGVRVNAVAPGVVETDILEGIVDDSRKTLAGYGSAHLLGRVAQADEIAKVIAFLASDWASFMTGAIVNVDGGYTTT